MMKERQSATRKDNRGRILKKGEGQDKDGRYYYNYVDIHGKRKRVYNLDLVELRQEEKIIQQNIEDGIDTEAANRTLNEQFEIYMSTKNLKKTTETEYWNKWRRHVAGSLGKKKLVDIRKSDIQLFYKKLSDIGLSSGSIQLYARLISPALESAADDDIIRKNPAKGCSREYSSKTKEKTALTLEQQKRFMEFVRTSKRYYVYFPFIAFALSTACRKGEMIGLRWDDVNLKNRTISINHQLQYVLENGKSRFVASSPKSDKSVRVLPMTEKCYRALIMQREHQLMLGIDHNVEVAGMKNFVFTSTVSTPYRPDFINEFLNNIVNAYNKLEEERALKKKREPDLLPHITCHALRHTACTRLAESNVNIKVLQQFMGHSDIQTTMNIYNHVDHVRMKAEIEKAERTSEVI